MKLIFQNSIIALIFLFAFNTGLCDDVRTSEKRQIIKIISIGGGGVKGIVPARILQEIEEKLDNKSIAENFDIITGTSTGGVIALLLNIPNEQQEPKYNAKEIVSLYKNLSSKIFKNSWRTLWTINGLIHAKYSSKHLYKLFKEYFKDKRISQSITKVLIPSYDISNDKPEIFTKNQAQEDNHKDSLMRDVAMATSAAPSYFEPFKMDNKLFVDGGLIMNNPVLAAYIHSLILNGNKKTGYFILSLDTEGIGYKYPKSSGIISWVRQIINIAIDGVAMLNNKQAKLIVETLGDHNSNLFHEYIALHVSVPQKHQSLDDGSKKNIDSLIKIAERYIESEKDQINKIANILNEYQNN